MSSPPSDPAGFTIRPRGPGRVLFEGPEFRYEFVHPLLEHEDFEPMVVARRKPLKGRGPTRLVLLKRLVRSPLEERRMRAVEEVRLSMYLEHPHIGRVLGLEWHEGWPYVVMEHLEGCFLETAMETSLLKGGPLSPAFAAAVAADVADALHHVHRCRDERGRPLGIVHRAVSPMRIRLGLRGEVRLCDFSVAWSRLLGRLPTHPQVLRADVVYAAPEVFRFLPVDGRADLYSLGLVLLEVLTGQHPLDPPDERQAPLESPEVARYNASVRTERPTWTRVGNLADRIMRFGPEEVERAARAVPQGLKQILHRALRANPEERYPTGAEMRDALRDWLRGLGRPFGREELAAELAHLLREPPSPDEVGAFPTEQGVLPTPEEAARTVARARRRRKKERRP
jgi:eukaryotic-like serine/threonine-protein kinase